ncbi:23133_t:CDS:2, partial [Gigaspora margarita]
RSSEYNMTKPRQLNLPVAKIEAVHTSSDIRKAPSDITNSLQQLVFIAWGQRLRCFVRIPFANHNSQSTIKSSSNVSLNSFVDDKSLFWDTSC